MGRRSIHCALAILLGLGTVACGDDDDPTAPGPLPPAIAISANASFGVAQITTFAFTAQVADPNGDPVSVTWNFGDGSTGAGTTVWKTFLSAGTVEATATVRDHTGLSATSSAVSVTVGSASGTWDGTIDLAACEAGTKPLTLTLTQAGSVITGSVSLPEGLCSSAPIASLDLAEPGRMFGSGAVRIRAVIPASIDGSFEGQLAATGLEMTGTLKSADLADSSFTLTRQ